jgi:hypothetical protein
MNRAQLLAELAEAGTEPAEAVFVERSGEDYRWSRLPPDEVLALAVTGTPGQATSSPGPDAWILYSGPWPAADRPEELPAFLEDLLAEMESMCGGADRCRWPLDQPYPPGH